MHLKALLPLLLLSLSACSQKENIGAKKYTKLVWSDEFEGSGLPDEKKWSYDTGYIRNRELQYYTFRRPENAKLEGGNLLITARLDSLHSGANIYPVTSAALITRYTQTWTYGRIEVRAKIPSSLGTWPAIWMLGANIDEVDWPACGELDIMEHVGYMPDTLHANVHTKKYNHAIGTGKGSRLYMKAPYADFHVYAMDWFPDHIDFFVDSTLLFTYKNEGTGKDAWPFDSPQYLILNVAFGGAWGGSKGVDAGSLPQQMLVDYVRVYQ